MKEQSASRDGVAKIEPTVYDCAICGGKVHGPFKAPTFKDITRGAPPGQRSESVPFSELRSIPEGIVKNMLAGQRLDVLAEVGQRLHDCYNMQRAGAWPHCEGVARAEEIVRVMRKESSERNDS